MGGDDGGLFKAHAGMQFARCFLVACAGVLSHAFAM